MLPHVSLITPTYNRQQFWRNTARMMMKQDYPHELMEWVIIDDSDNGDLRGEEEFKHDPAFDIKIRFYKFSSKVSLAQKRNHLNRQATGKYIINIDDDDYYPPTRVSHAVEILEREGTPLVGSSKMYMYYTRDNTVYQLGPYADNHGTAATMAYTKEYTKTHDYGTGDYAEEGTFSEQWKTPMAQLEPMKTVLAMSHSNNTIEKTMFLEQKNGQVGQSINLTTLTLEDFAKEADALEFYQDLRSKYKYVPNAASTEVAQKMAQNNLVAQAKYTQISSQKLLQEIMGARRRYEIEMLLLHDNDVGRIEIQSGGAPRPPAAI